MQPCPLSAAFASFSLIRNGATSSAPALRAQVAFSRPLSLRAIQLTALPKVCRSREFRRLNPIYKPSRVLGSKLIIDVPAVVGICGRRNGFSQALWQA